MTNHVLRNGRKVALGTKLGQGGEGAVYTITGQPAFVAKIYDKLLDPKHAEKLEVICQLRTDKLSEVCAWPIETIYLHGKACGFVMPLVTKATEIHELYGSVGRKRLFPKADWAFLIHVAKNLAAAIHNLHAANIVVGDFNQRNIVVSEDATVKLWDCDSFQVERNGRTFYCTVGVPEFTAPELQTCTSFDSVKRTPQHDRFSLAVMIFYLLFLGRHPFSGDPTDPRVNSYELQDAIASRKFAYSPNAPVFGVKPPKISPPVHELGSELMPLFIKAFETTIRPAAADWYAALTKLESELSRCSFNPGHVFHRRLRTCPWCGYEAQWSITTFLPTACPPRFVKAFDYAGLIASVKHCFQDFKISMPPEPSGFRGLPLPPLCMIPNEIAVGFNQAKGRLNQWIAEISMLNGLCQRDSQIAEVIKQGRAVQLEYKTISMKLEAIQAKANESRQKIEVLRAKIERLEKHSVAGTISALFVMPIAAGASVCSASFSAPIRIASVFGLSVAAYFASLFYKKFRGEQLDRKLTLSTMKANQIESEVTHPFLEQLILESRLKQLNDVLKSLRSTDNERIDKVKVLLVNAETSKNAANANLLIKQAAFDKAKANFEESAAARRIEYSRRMDSIRTLEDQRKQLGNELRKLSCPEALRNCRSKFTDAQGFYDRVQKQFMNELDRLRHSSRQRQLTEFLENFSIEKLKPEGLGSSLLINLKSRGIETAADVDRVAVSQVRGFGLKRTAMLVEWRRHLESKFVFDPSRGLSQQDHDSARLKFSLDFQKAESYLKVAAEQLRLQYESTKQKISTAERVFAIANESLGQARANAIESP
jgi:DNA-binding helix-hairpin-helix protein with protein kinase domain